MKKLSINEIACACKGKIMCCADSEHLYINSITTDSRKAKKGCLFIPLKGERADGHNFIESVFIQGAACCLSEKELALNKPYILVSSCYQAIKDIAEYYRSLFNIPFIGITGSVGKTSTKEMIASVLSQKYNVLKTQGNFNNELGVPLTLFGLEEEHQVAVIEMGISEFGEMTRLSKMVKPDICVITNIGDCHLENLIDRSGVLKAKTEMFKYRKKNGKVFLNGDDAYLATVKEWQDVNPCFYGLNSSNDYYAENIENKGIEGIQADLCFDGNKIPVIIPAIGTYMVSNALAAVAIGKYLCMDNDEIARGIAYYKTVGSRDGVIDTGYITIIDDCYNANPNSVKGGIDTLCNLRSGVRKVCILGDMKELGTNWAELHQSVGEYAKNKNVDVIVAVGENAVEIVNGADRENGVYYFETAAKAIESLRNIIEKGDIVLVKASRAMKFENIVEALKALN